MDTTLSWVASTPLARDRGPVSYPLKHEVLGVKVSVVSYSDVTEVLIRLAKEHRPTIVDFTPASLIVEAARNPTFRLRLNSFDLVCPDGQPVRWCLNWFHNVNLRETVCGTAATLCLCEAAARENVGVYLYGSTPETVQKLQEVLQNRFPTLAIVGAESPPFGPLLTEAEGMAARRIAESGAGLVFVGLGSPKQENFAWEQKGKINAVQLCVGAAFDFIAGTRKRAPRWMQKGGLEWLYRLASEPRRLGKRYLL